MSITDPRDHDPIAGLPRRTFLWAAGASVAAIGLGALPAEAAAKNTLYRDQRLNPGQFLLSGNGKHRFIQQKDGNLVLYRSGKPVWANNRDGKKGAWTMLQKDGNLVSRLNGKVIWASGTDGKKGVRLVVINNGDLTLRNSSDKVVWATQTGVEAKSSLGSRVDAFVKKYQGKYVDVDGAYGAQCTDLFNRYHSEIMGGSYVRMGGNGGAANLWVTTNAQMRSKYTKVSASATARKGDIAVWAASRPYSGGYGHVSIVLADKGSKLATFSQNPGAAQRRDDSKAHLRGYFRPK